MEKQRQAKTCHKHLGLLLLAKARRFQATPNLLSFVALVSQWLLVLYLVNHHHHHLCLTVHLSQDANPTLQERALHRIVGQLVVVLVATGSCSHILREYNT